MSEHKEILLRILLSSSVRVGQQQRAVYVGLHSAEHHGARFVSDGALTRFDTLSVATPARL